MATINLFILLSCAAVLVSALNGDVAKAGERIWGGEEAQRGVFTWQVALANKTHDGYYYPVYGGALISNQWVLTDGRVSIHVDVILGATHLYDDQEYKLVTKFEKVVYEFEHDIVLGKLVAPVEFNQYIAPIKLPRSTDYLEGGASVWFSGWGYVSDHAEYVNELRFLELTTLDQEQCSPIPNYYVCTDGSEGKCPSLGGDEGGALVQIVDGEWTHMGVMRSTQYDDCSRGGPTRYTRTPPMVDFIYATVGPINNSN